MNNQPDCKQCRKTWAVYNKEPDCDNCSLTIRLTPRCRAAVNIYMLVQDQVIIAGMDGKVIGLNQIAVWEAIDRYKGRYEIEDQTWVFEKVIGLHRHINSNQQQEEEAEE